MSNTSARWLSGALDFELTARSAKRDVFLAAMQRIPLFEFQARESVGPAIAQCPSDRLDSGKAGGQWTASEQAGCAMAVSCAGPQAPATEFALTPFFTLSVCSLI